MHGMQWCECIAWDDMDACIEYNVLKALLVMIWMHVWNAMLWIHCLELYGCMHRIQWSECIACNYMDACLEYNSLNALLGII